MKRMADHFIFNFMGIGHKILLPEDLNLFPVLFM